MNAGLFVLRVVLGLLLVGHGSQKLFGLFGGHGLSGTGAFFDSVGFRPGRTMALMAGATEVGGGILLILGLVTPLAAASVIGTMLVAASVHLKSGLWGQNGGYELALLYAVAAVALAFTGPGTWSLDHALGQTAPAGTGWAVAAVFLGGLSGLALVVRARSALGAEATPASH
jgi:putative oxidoreductase